MRNATLGLIALTLLPAYAPAPLPRPERSKKERISLDWFQGTWEVISNESVVGTERRRSEWGITHIRVRGTRWTLMANDAESGSYTIGVDGSFDPARIDWFPLEQPTERTLWLGVMKREGDRLLILYSDGAAAEYRPRDFGSARQGSYLITVRRASR